MCRRRRRRGGGRDLPLRLVSKFNREVRWKPRRAFCLNGSSPSRVGIPPPEHRAAHGESECDHRSHPGRCMVATSFGVGHSIEGPGRLWTVLGVRLFSTSRARQYTRATYCALSHGKPKAASRAHRLGPSLRRRNQEHLDSATDARKVRPSGSDSALGPGRPTRQDFGECATLAIGARALGCSSLQVSTPTELPRVVSARRARKSKPR